MITRRDCLSLFILSLTLIAFMVGSVSARTITGMDYTATNDIAYQWNDISSTGTAAISGDSDFYDVATVPVGFNFDFFGLNFTEINFNSQGIASFDGFSVDSENLFPGQAYWANNASVIVPYGDQLTTTLLGGNAVYCETSGTSGQQTLTVQWQDVERIDGAGKATFQMILHEATNEIEFQYKDVTFENDPAVSNGLSANVGVQADYGVTNWLRWSDGDVTIADQSAVLFAPRVVEYSDNMPEVGLDVAYRRIHGSVHAEAHMELGGYYPDPEYYQEPEIIWEDHWDDDSDSTHVEMSTIASIQRYMNGTYLEIWSQENAYGDLYVEQFGPEVRIGMKTSIDGGTCFMGFDEYTGTPEILNYDGMVDGHIEAEVQGSIMIEPSPHIPEGATFRVEERWYDEDGVGHVGACYDLTVGDSFEIAYWENACYGADVKWVTYTVVPEPSTLALLVMGFLLFGLRRVFK